MATVQSMMRWRLSLAPQDMWGVMMQFLAFSSGLSPRMLLVFFHHQVYRLL